MIRYEDKLHNVAWLQQWQVKSSFANTFFLLVLQLYPALSMTYIKLTDTLQEKQAYFHKQHWATRKYNALPVLSFWSKRLPCDPLHLTLSMPTCSVITELHVEDIFYQMGYMVWN